MKRKIFCALALVPVFFASSLHGQTTPAPTSPWGISSSASSMRNYPEWFPKMAEAGIGTIRLFPEWRSLQSADGTWRFDRPDTLVKTAADNHLQISGLLFGAAPGSREPGHAFPMNDLDAWSKYTATVVARYKDHVHDWEVWNEGNAAFNDRHNTTADYATLVAAAYDAAKKADPGAQIGMSVASFDAPYLDQAILAQAKAGKPNHFDYLCIHPYELLEDIQNPGGEIPYLWMSRLLRDALKADAPDRANADIWITEVGMPVGRRVTEADAAKAAVKAYVMAIAQGIAKVMWFEARDPSGEQQGFGLLTRQGAPRASYTAFKTMTTQLGQSPKYLGWLALGKDGKGYGLLFRGATQPILVAWMPAGTTDDATTFSSDVQLIDSLTGVMTPLKAGQPLALTDTPLFITSLPPDRLAEAKDNAAKSFPWGGDYSAVKTVSIQFGPQTAPNGLMPVGRATLPAYKFDDGSTGVRLEGNPSATFYVHPSFANIKTRDYYIRLTLRRIGQGNVGMNFAYEIADTKGQNGPMRHSGGWFSLPEKEGWQTHTWHLTDACFSKMWGYDISFRPEKSVPFVIGKVEVSTEAFKD